MPISESDLAEMLAANPSLRLAPESRLSRKSVIASPPASPEPGRCQTKQNPETPARAAIPLHSTPPQPLTFIVPGTPIGKPRQSRRDKWAKRPTVLRYRAWADRARECAQAAVGRRRLPNNGVEITAYFPMPEFWSKKKKAEMADKPHRVKPDLDNLIKCLDAIFPDSDSMIHEVIAKKRWNDGAGPRTVITLY